MLPGNKHSLKSVVRKVLAAFVLVSVAIFLALTIARLSFRELLSTVDDLSRPNEKLSLLNTAFEEITTLDQLQRAEAIQNPRKPYNLFLEQSSALDLLIDSLKRLEWDTSQLHRLDEMKQVLQQRNDLFFSYLKVKAELLENRDFFVQIDSLESILEKDEIVLDSGFLMQETTTTTTYLPDTTFPRGDREAQQSFLKRLFSKKRGVPAPPDTPRVKIEKQTSLAVDSALLERQNQALAQIEMIMREMERDQQSQRKELQRQELELIHANSVFINQLLNILHQVENEELERIEAKNSHAVRVMNQTVFRIDILMLSFFIAAAILVYLIWIDVGKSNYYKEQLEKARDEAENLSKIKQRFLANMSHEIRTPLQSIIGFAEQLKEKDGNREEVSAIHSSSEHLLHIVNEVLDYSRIVSGNFKLGRESFRLFYVVKEVEASMRVQAERKNLTFVLNTENAADYTLCGDPFRLRQILYNLLGNAVKFTHHGFIKLAVKTFEEPDRVRCSFEITDTGIGMEHHDLEKIFGQFEQIETAATRQYGGTGLGLTIVKALIDAQHGVLDVSSKPGIGSSFKVDLRFDKDVERSARRIIYDKQELPIPSGSMVLAVDDDPLILRLAAMILKKHNIPFETFPNAHAILSFTPKQQVTTIFLDIRMPDLNGIDLCHQLRERYGQETRFIALTAQALPDEQENLLREGFDGVLAKPFHEQELVAAITHQEEPEPVEEEEEYPNLEPLRRMTMGDEELFQSIVTQLLDETIEDLERIEDHRENFRTDQVRETVHKLAGRLAQVGLLALGIKLRTLEKQIVMGHPLSEMNEEIDNLMDNVRRALAQIRLTATYSLN